MNQNKKSQNGKGSSPRSCFSRQFKDNYDEIDWSVDSKRKRCDECGGLINLDSNSHLIEQNADGTVRHKSCNFN